MLRRYFFYHNVDLKLYYRDMNIWIQGLILKSNFYLFFLLIRTIILIDVVLCFGFVYLRMSQARTWISNVICRGLFFIIFNEFRWEVTVRFADISGIGYHICWKLNLFFLLIRTIILCCVLVLFIFVMCLVSCVLCTLCCQCLWIVHSCFTLRYSLTCLLDTLENTEG
jgi:hypothetical protein